jgi:hypothetical protein
MSAATPARVSACDDFDIGDLLLTVLQVEGTVQLVVRTPASNLWPIKALVNVFVGPTTAAALRACADHLDGLELPTRV